MKLRALVLFLGVMIATDAVAAPAAGADAAAAPAEPDLEELIAKVATLHAADANQTLAQMIRALKSPEQQRAACLYIRAVAYGEVDTFMSLVPDKGLVLEREETKKKEKLSRAEIGKRAARKEHGRPSFVGVLNEVADGDPKDLSWFVEQKKGRVTIAANGAFAWATFSRGADGRFLMDRITISFNDD